LNLRVDFEKVQKYKFSYDIRIERHLNKFAYVNPKGQ
jgi:hypothetical protein